MGSVLRIRGKNVLENEHVKVFAVIWLHSPGTNVFSWWISIIMFLLQIGAFHTIELEMQRPFVLRKVCFLCCRFLFNFFKMWSCIFNFFSCLVALTHSRMSGTPWH